MTTNTERVKEKTWVTSVELNPVTIQGARQIADALKINPIVAQLLYSRGYRDAKSAERFIKLEEEIFCDPYMMADMISAVERIKKAVDNKEKITIYGDYDVDGVTSVCTMYLYLRSQGANVDYYIPNRAGEGYGVSPKAIDAIKEGGTSLIITVDTGVTANAEVDYAKGIGVDFVITDHHECHAELPKAVAVVNPHRPDCEYPFKELAGVGVVFKLICAYEKFVSGDSMIKSTFRIVRQYADLVSIGTIADVMPIKEENRIIVKYGLGIISNSTRPGIAALIDAAASGGRTSRRQQDKRKKQQKITSGYVGFTLAPRINAAGRIKSAMIAVELFLSESYEEAYRIAETLCTANKERQAEENKIIKEAYQMIEGLDIDKNPVIVLDADTWHHGVIGIVSSRITEKYSRPSILVSFEGNSDMPNPEDIGKGSGRSIKGLNLVEALCNCSDYLVKFGGHELAAGLSITRENLPKFKDCINEYARNNLKEEDMVPILEADMEIPYSDISLDLAESIQSILEPFGVENPMPLFIVRGVNLLELSGVSENKHSRLIIGDGTRTLSAMYFSNSPEALGVYVGDKIDCLFSLDINEWQDRKSVQLVIKDIKPSEAQISAQDKEFCRFAEIHSGGTFTASEDVLPDRTDCAQLFSYLRRVNHQSAIDTFSIRDLASKLNSSEGNKRMNYIKLKFIMLIFKELNIIGVEEVESDVYKFTFHFSSTKKDLEKSGVLRKLRSQLR